MLGGIHKKTVSCIVLLRPKEKKFQATNFNKSTV